LKTFILKIPLYEKREEFIRGNLITNIKSNDRIYLYTDEYRQTNDSFAKIESNSAHFAYNKISINKDKVVINNDILGQLPLYFHNINNEIFISNNIWDLASYLKKNGFKIVSDNAAIESLKFCKRILPVESTIFKDIKILPAGCMCIFNNDTHKISYKTPMIQVESDANIEDVCSEIIHTLKDNICNINADEVWFGNSGGLDSRLIPEILLMTNKNIKLKGFTISGNERNKTNTNRSADLISKKYNFTNTYHNFKDSDFRKSIERDIYINPLAPADFHKNIIYEKMIGKFILNAGNGFIIANDNNFWKKYANETDGWKAYFKKVLLKSDINIDKEKFYLDTFEAFIKDLDKNDNFSIIRIIHQLLLNKISPMGGFESQSYAGSFQYLYSNVLASKSLKWNKNYFYDRTLQRYLFDNYFKEIEDIPDQNGVKINSNFISKVIQKIIGKFILHGLDYELWKDSLWFSQVKSISEIQPNKFRNTTFQESLDLIKINLLKKRINEI
jgi:hypothetical protein